MKKWIENNGNRRANQSRKLFFSFVRHVVTELLVTEQVYVEELRTILNVNIDRV